MLPTLKVAEPPVKVTVPVLGSRLLPPARTSVPPLMVVAPVKVLMPLSVCVPAPIFVRLMPTAPSAMTPE